MSSEGDVTEGAKNYEAYNLHFQNLSNKPLKVKGDVVNRVSRKNFTRTQTSQRSVSRSRRPFSVGLGYGPLMLVAGSGGFGVANPITGGIIGARREQAYSSPISAKISRLSPDGVMNRQVLPKSSFDFRYMLPAGSTGEEKLAFNYSVGSELSKSFHKGMTKAEADTIASVTPVNVATQTKAGSANSLASNPTAASSNLPEANKQQRVNGKSALASKDASKNINKVKSLQPVLYFKDAKHKSPVKVMNTASVKGQPFDHETFRILFYQQNQSTQALADQKWTLTSTASSAPSATSSLKAQSETLAKAGRSKVVTKNYALSVSQVKPGILEIEPTSSLVPAHYVLKSADKKLVYEFDLI